MSFQNVAAVSISAAALLAFAGPTHATVYVNSQAAYNAAAPTAVLIEDFEATGQASDTAIYASFSHNGVGYLGLAGSPAPNLFISSAGYTNYGAGVGPTTSKILTANGDESFVVTFASAVSAFGFDAYFNGLGPTTLNAFNGATLLDSVTTANAFDFKGHLGVAGVGPITSFTWVTTAGGQLNTGIDNLTTAQAIPEPATWALMVAGCAGLAGMARGRSRRQTDVRAD